MLLTRTVITAALIGAISLTGCQSTSSAKADPDPRLTNDEFSVDYDSYVTSCVWGAAATGAACLLLTDSDNRAICLAAAAAGCGIAMGGNAILDNIRKQYHTKEEQLNALIADLSDNRQKAVSMVAAANQVYADDKNKLAKLEKQIKQNQANKQEAKMLLAQYDANIKVLKSNYEYYQKSLTSYKEARKGLVESNYFNNQEKAQIAKLDKQIKQLERTIDALSDSVQSYTADRNVLNLQIEKMDQIAAA